MNPIALIFVALLNSILGLSILFPILGPLGRELGLTDLQIGWLSTAYAVTQFLASPMWGRRSERIGRKPVLLSGILGFSVTFFVFGLVAHLGRAGVLRGELLFVSLVLTRLVGGVYSSATLPAAQAYIADVTSRSERTSGMAVVGAAFGLGIVLGPALAALLAPFGLLVPVYASAMIALVNALFVRLRLPEPDRKRTTVGRERTSMVARELRVLLLTGFLLTMASVALEQTVAFYAQDRLKLTPEGAARTVGIALSVCGAAAAAVQGGVVRRLRWSPSRLLKIGVSIGVAALLTLLVMHTGAVFVAAMALHGLGQGFTMPGLTAAVSLRARENEQGAAAGLNSAALALARALGPVLGTGLYEWRPEYPYAFGVCLLIGAYALLNVPTAHEVPGEAERLEREALAQGRTSEAP